MRYIYGSTPGGIQTLLVKSPGKIDIDKWAANRTQALRLLDIVSLTYVDTGEIMTDKEQTELCNLIIEANWTGDDEEKNPRLKTLRTLAGLYLRRKE